MVLKICIYQALGSTILLYGCETWLMRASNLQKLELFNHYCLHHILCVHWQLFISNAIVCSCCNISSLQQAVLSKCLRWFRYVLRHYPDDFIDKVIKPAPSLDWKQTMWKPAENLSQNSETLYQAEPGPLSLCDWLTLVFNTVVDHYVWSAFARDMTNSMDGASPTSFGWKPKEVQVVSSPGGHGVIL